MTDGVPFWAAGVIGLAFVAALGLQTARLHSAQGEIATLQTNAANEKAQAAEAARAQSDAYRQLESQNHEQVARIDQQTAQRLAAARADADTARAAGDRLQHDVDNYLRATRAAAADCAATGQCAPDASPIVLLADLRRRADQRATELAATADDARERGSACERAYDAAKTLTEKAAATVENMSAAGPSQGAKAPLGGAAPPAQRASVEGNF